MSRTRSTRPCGCSLASPSSDTRFAHVHVHVLVLVLDPSHVRAASRGTAAMSTNLLRRRFARACYSGQRLRTSQRPGLRVAPSAGRFPGPAAAEHEHVHEYEHVHAECSRRS